MVRHISIEASAGPGRTGSDPRPAGAFNPRAWSAREELDPSETSQTIYELHARCGAASGPVLAELDNDTPAELAYEVWRGVLKTFESNPPTRSPIGYLRRVHATVLRETIALHRTMVDADRRAGA